MNLTHDARITGDTTGPVFSVEFTRGSVCHASVLGLLFLLACVAPTRAQDNQPASPQRPIFGLFFEDIPADVAKEIPLEKSQGVVVTLALPDLPAAKAGIQQGDILVALNRQPITSQRWAREKLAAQRVGSQVTLGLVRDGRPMEVTCDARAIPHEAVLAALMQAAEDGNALAQLRVAEVYWNGQGVPRDFAEGTRWCRKAAEQGLGAAKVALGECYASGRGVEKDLEEALRWYRQAAERREPRGLTKLGLHYYHGAGVERDLQEAIRWLQAAAELNEPQAQNVMGLIYYNRHEGIRPDLSFAFDMFSKAAKQDFDWAWFHLGRMYEDAKFENADPAKAFRCYQQAAKLGLVDAYSRIGDCFQTGRGVTRNYPKAVAAYRKAIEGGSNEGYAQLGYLYEHGYGVQKDVQEAVKLYEAGAEKGNAISTFNLASLHLSGKIPEDAEKARELLEKVAESGLQPLASAAQRSLGSLYEIGNGVTKDLKKAAEYYLAAAQAGDTEATVPLRQYDLRRNALQARLRHGPAVVPESGGSRARAAQFAIGNMYERGLALPQDRTEAIAWYLKARDAGDDMAAERLKELNQ
jgi:TPR repeat protein